MPAGQRIMAMMLFGTALLSLVFFSSCSGDGGAMGTSGTTRRPATSTEPPKSVPTSPTSPSAGSVSPAVAGKMSKTTDKITTNTSISSANTTQSTTQTPAKGGAESLTQTPMTASTPNVTLSAKEHLNKTMDRPDTLNSTIDPSQKATEATTTNTTEKREDQSPTDSSAKDDSSYSSILLPVIIALIVISLVIFLLMALYKICLKTTPERQENGTEQAPSDKENVKLISVKTTSPETGEQSSQGKNKTRQHNDSSSHLSNKCVRSKFSVR
ncbi:endomucin isoform X2 [Anolis carolinensis]|uniref:endomucin isoform X2 n=1 Tax=Anolis carolinensis TaxID=28377 RepID=UPI0004629D4B|nr:PREDICTED: endomucin isoform X2 [Anolis carolinensis]|eukprot:XP_008116479.1 PREDICTED: endomucin isoform X2 [Anolis carolinensis]